jgi:hypothetical protein
MHQSKLWCGRDQIERGRGSGDFAAGATVADGDVLLNSQHSGRGTEIGMVLATFFASCSGISSVYWTAPQRQLPDSIFSGS